VAPASAASAPALDSATTNTTKNESLTLGSTQKDSSINQHKRDRSAQQSGAPNDRMFEQSQQPVEAIAAPPWAADRERLLRQLFAYMDGDADGKVSIADYHSAVQSDHMRRFFTFMDSDADGMLDVNDWLHGMGKLGTLMSAEQFEGQLTKTMEKTSSRAAKG